MNAAKSWNVVRVSLCHDLPCIFAHPISSLRRHWQCWNLPVCHRLLLPRAARRDGQLMEMVKRYGGERTRQVRYRSTHRRLRVRVAFRTASSVQGHLGGGPTFELYDKTSQPLATTVRSIYLARASPCKSREVPSGIYFMSILRRRYMSSPYSGDASA